MTDKEILKRVRAWYRSKIPEINVIPVNILLWELSHLLDGIPLRKKPTIPLDKK